MRNLLFLLALSCTLQSMGQEERLAFKFSAVALADDISFPTLQAGVEYSISKRLSWFNEGGWKYRKSFLEHADTAFYSSRGFKLKSELRYYIKNGMRRMEGRYLALNVFYTHDLHNTSILYLFQGDSSNMRIDDFGVSKIIQGMNLVFGLQKKFRKHQVVEIYAGLGIRFRDVSTRSMEFQPGVDVHRTGPDFNIPDWRNYISSSTTSSELLNVTMGVRIGWR